MLYLTLLSCALGAAALVKYIWEKLRAWSLRALLWKSFVSCLFIATGFFALCCQGAVPMAGLLVLGGLICGLLGDVWLDLKFIYPDDEQLYTYAGFLAFAAGHILYMAAMLILFGGNAKPLHFIIAALVSLALGFVTVLMGPVLKLDYGKYRNISLFYGPLLFGSTVLSATLAFCTGFSEPFLTVFCFGGVLFLLSDLVLCGTYFGKGKDRPIDLILNYVFYYGAQFVIALSLLFI